MIAGGVQGSSLATRSRYLLAVTAIIIILLLVNALYVAAEFATVSARRARLAQLAEEGNRLAPMILSIIEDPRQLDTYVAACQLGITVSSLVLGFYAQASLTGVVAPWLEQLGGLAPAASASLAATIILLLLTVVQVIVGELVPKNIGVQYPERLAMATAVPLRWSMALFRPLIWLFNGSGQILLRLMGVEPATEHAHIHSPEEITMLVQESGVGGLLDREERRLIENTLLMGKSVVRQVMIPRTRLLAASVEQSCAELFTTLADSPYSRLPLYQGSIDNIVGLVHLRDLLCLHRRPAPQSVREIMGPALFLPETMPADEAFALLQLRRAHAAVVLDEFGGTAGMVTLEDLIEEIFGELQDEFDQEVPPFRALPGNRVVIRWDWLVGDLNELLGLGLPADQVDTVGGLVLSRLGQVPQVGDIVQFENVAFRVEKVEGKGVSAVSLAVTPEQVQSLREAVS